MDNPKLVSAVKTALMALEPDVVKRNQYMNDRDRYVYGSGLYDGLDIENWFAEHNYLQRVVDIHTAQLMGRPYNVYSYYNKEDLSPFEDQPDQLHLMELENKKKKANADTRKKLLDAIRRDNNQTVMDEQGARIGSAFGLTVYKQWADFTKKKIFRSLIESPQSLYIGWSSDDFRAVDFMAHVHQISADSAYREFGKALKEGEIFETSTQGSPFGLSQTGDNITSDPLSQSSSNKTDNAQQTDREMVTVIDLAGYLTGWTAEGAKSAKEVKKRGEETRLGILIVGGHTVQIIAEETKVPKFYMIANRVAPRRAIPLSDLPQSALDINREIVQLEADCMTWANKNLFKKYKAKNISPENLPKWKSRRTQMMSIGDDQDIEEIQVSTQQMQEFRSLINEKMNNFVRVTNIGRVLFDDPSIEANSAQALITTMKPVIDIVEGKQKRWESAMREMDTDALNLVAEMIPEQKEAITADDWFLCYEWPSIFRKEDSTYQAMYLNRVTQGLISLETYMEKMGDDYSEEIDRLRDEMKDPVVAAVLGRQIGALAANLITPPVAPTPDKRFNININAKTDGDPAMNEAVIAEALGGDAGAEAVDKLAAAQEQSPPGQVVTPDQNTDMTQPVSVPGSGQPAVSPEGAVAQANQNAGA